jgi:tripartite-type tricarboxylate transporter receptor subunit TctC
VPYKGAATAVQEMIGGRIDLMFDNMSAARAPVETGRVKALAVSPASRVPQMMCMTPALAFPTFFNHDPGSLHEYCRLSQARALH